jgi:hypothetical protein
VISSLALPLAAALLLTAWAVAWHSPRWLAARSAVVGVAALAPALLLTLAFLGARSRAGDVRVALEGLRVQLGSNGRGEVRIGGAAPEDDLVVRDLPSGFLRIRPTPVGVDLVVAPENPATGGSRAVAVVHGDGDPRPFYNAVELRNGDHVVLPGGQRLTFDAARGALGGADFPALPSRRSTVLGWPVPIGRDLPAEQIIFPLRHYAAPQGDASGDLDALSSFVCRAGWFRHTPYLVITDPGLRVDHADGSTEAYQPRIASIVRGSSAHLALDRVDLREEMATGGRSSRVQERRSLRILPREGGVDVVFDTPVTIRLRADALAELRRRAARAGTAPLLATVPAGFEAAAPGGAMLLQLPVIGAPLAAEVFSRIQVPSSGNEVRVTSHTGTRSYVLGDAFAIGQDAAAVLRATRLDVPWGAIVLASAAALVGWLWGAGRRLSWLAFVVVSGVELCLALRYLIAFQGAALAPEVASAVPLALAALVSVPFVLEGALVLYREGRWRLATLAQGAFATLALVSILADLGGRRLVWCTALLPVALAWGIGRFGLPWLDRLEDDRRPRSFAAPRESFRGIVLLGAVLVVVRLGTLLAFGWKERIDLLGQGVAVSLYYTPAVLLLLALLWRRRERWSAVIGVWVVFFVFYLALPLIAHDLGSALIFPMPAMLLFALPLLWKPTLRHAVAAIPLLVVVLVHLVLLPLLPALGLAPRLTCFGTDPSVTAKSADSSSRDENASDEALLGRRARTDQNLLRLWSYVAPEELREVGTSSAEGLVLVTETLRAYATRGALGAGYLGVPLAESLRATQLDDNLSAVHLLGTFGWLGTLAVLTVLGGWMAAPLLRPLSDRAAGPFSEREAFGALLLWTLAVAGLYMIAANAGLLIFTGKNVYFLAAASRSDLAESVVLAVLALGALTVRERRGAALAVERVGVPVVDATEEAS